MYTPETLAALLEKWQATLRLQDWDIRLQAVTAPWRKTGDIKIDNDNRAAVLMINLANPSFANLEAVVIHELLHLRLWGMDQLVEELLHCVYGQNEADPKYSFASTQFMKTLETTAEDLTKSFAQLGADDKRPPLDKAQRQADEEREKAPTSSRFGKHRSYRAPVNSASDKARPTPAARVRDIASVP